MLVTAHYECCSEVCPEDIHITTTRSSFKERGLMIYYDPVRWFLRKLQGKRRMEYKLKPLSSALHQRGYLEV